MVKFSGAAAHRITIDCSMRGTRRNTSSRMITNMAQKRTNIGKQAQNNKQKVIRAIQEWKKFLYNKGWSRQTNSKFTKLTLAEFNKLNQLMHFANMVGQKSLLNKTGWPKKCTRRNNKKSKGKNVRTCSSYNPSSRGYWNGGVRNTAGKVGKFIF